jgi:hypothetical protein
MSDRSPVSEALSPAAAIVARRAQRPEILKRPTAKALDDSSDDDWDDDEASEESEPEEGEEEEEASDAEDGGGKRGRVTRHWVGHRPSGLDDEDDDRRKSLQEKTWERENNLGMSRHSGKERFSLPLCGVCLRCSAGAVGSFSNKPLSPKRQDFACMQSA